MGETQGGSMLEASIAGWDWPLTCSSGPETDPKL